MKRNTRAGQVSLAIGADRITAVTGDMGRVYVVEREAGADGTKQPLAQSFAEIDRRVTADGSKAAVVDIALMPSLCDVRLVNLPPLKPAEAEAVIRRDLMKHFTVSAEHRVIGVRVPRRGRSAPGATAPVMAAVASHAVLDDIAAAAAHTGWTVRKCVPAHAAWLKAAVHGENRDAAGRPRAFVAIDGATAFAARIENGSPTQLRRLGALQAPAIAAALGNGPGTVMLISDDASRNTVASALTSAGWSVLPSEGSAAVGAARYAADADLQLISDAHHATRSMNQRSLANRLAAAAVILALASAGVARWGAQRELSAVRAKRASIHAQVTPLLALRDSVEQLEARIRETNALFEGGARWSKTLYEITMLLPTDAHLTRLNATGDTIEVEGVAARAGDALEALSRAPTLRNVHLQGPVQRELEAGATTSEHFAVQATLATAKKPSPAAKRHVTAPPSRSVADSDLGRLP